MRPSLRNVVLAVGTCAAIATSAARGQSGAAGNNQAPGNLPAGAKRVEQGVADVNALQGSLRVIQPQRRLPQNFSELYEFTDKDGKKKYARMSGAVTAVFSRSEYVETSIGTLPLIPAGAVFRLGRLTGSDGIDRGGSTAPNAVSTAVSTAMGATRGGETRVSTRVEAMRVEAAAKLKGREESAGDRRGTQETAGDRRGTQETAGDRRGTQETAGDRRGTQREAAAPVAGMMSDESYRRSRVRRLLEHAARSSVTTTETSNASGSGTNPTTSAEPSGNAPR